MTSHTAHTAHTATVAARTVDKGGFSVAACEFAEETGSNIEADVARVLLGTTEAELLAECLDGADEDRVAGIRDYVAAVIACAERATR